MAVSAGERALLVELLDRIHQPVIFAALLLDAAGQFGAHRFHRPSAKVLVDVARRKIQFGLRQVEAQHTIAHQPERVTSTASTF